MHSCGIVQCSSRVDPVKHAHLVDKPYLRSADAIAARDARTAEALPMAGMA